MLMLVQRPQNVFAFPRLCRFNDGFGGTCIIFECKSLRKNLDQELSQGG